MQLIFNEICYEYVEWIHLIQKRDQWHDLFNMVMNFLFSYKAVNLCDC
jgi:hypothetical protein